METRGRKTIDKEPLTETISIRFTKKELEDIEKIANNIGIAKTRLVRNLVLSSLDEAKFFNNIGALKGAKKLLDFKERLMNPKSGIKRKGILVFSRFLKEAERLTWSSPETAIVSGETPKKQREHILLAF